MVPPWFFAGNGSSLLLSVIGDMGKKSKKQRELRKILVDLIE